MTAWPSVLDQIEARLCLLEQQISRGEFGFEPVSMPVGLGPLPAACRQRAEALVATARDMERQVESAMTELAGTLNRRVKAEPARPAPAYVDRRA